MRTPLLRTSQRSLMLIVTFFFCQNPHAFGFEAQIKSLTPEIQIKGLRIVEKKVPIEYRDTSESKKIPHVIVEGMYDKDPGWNLFWGRKMIALAASGKFRLVVPLDAPKNYIYLIAQGPSQSQSQEYLVESAAWNEPPPETKEVKKP